MLAHKQKLQEHLEYKSVISAAHGPGMYDSTQFKAVPKKHYHFGSTIQRPDWTELN